MNSSAYRAANLLEVKRKDLAIRALTESVTISGLDAQHGVSRKFVYQQTHKACIALDEVFASATPDDEVLFGLAPFTTCINWWQCIRLAQSTAAKTCQAFVWA